MVFDILETVLGFMGVTGGIVLFIVFVLIIFAYRAYRSRLKGTGFDIQRHEDGFVVSTKILDAEFNKAKQQIFIQYKNPNRCFQELTLNFNDIVRIDTKEGVSEALLEEFLFEDSGIFDLAFRKDYADQIKTVSIEIKTKQSTFIPLLAVSEYKVRDFLDFITPFCLETLELFGLYEPVEYYVDQAFQELENACIEYGVPFRDQTSFR